MYAQASPLIHDSRKWTYKYEGGSEEPSLPGTSDNHSFSYSVSSIMMTYTTFLLIIIIIIIIVILYCDYITMSF